MNQSFHGEVAAWLLPFIERGEVARLPRDLFTPVAMGPTLEYMGRWLAGGEQGDPRRATQVLATAAWNAVRVRRSEAPATSAVTKPKRRARADHPLSSVEEAIDAIARGTHGDRGRRRRSRGRGRLHLRRREGDARDRALHDAPGRRPLLHAGAAEPGPGEGLLADGREQHLPHRHAVHRPGRSSELPHRHQRRRARAHRARGPRSRARSPRTSARPATSSC